MGESKIISLRSKRIKGKLLYFISAACIHWISEKIGAIILEL
jgi:hypothetical protein